MYLIVTRSFPPEVGGMQSLMWGLAKEMSKNFMIKVFADYYENHKEFDKKENFSIERVGGIKFLRKIRKAQLINEYLKESKVQGVIADHWKSLELIETSKKKYCLIHGKEINHAKGSSLNKRANKVLNNVEKVIANSDYTKDLVIQNGVEQEKVIVINPGVSPAKELNKTSLTKVESLLKTKSPRLITVSRFDKRKNHEKVLMAVRNLKQIYPNIVYICIGYGEEEQNLKDLVNELTDLDFNGDCLREECGIFGVYGHPDAAALTALGLHALQHRGQESVGIVSYDGDRFNAERRLGLVSENFTKASVLEQLIGKN